MYFTFLLGVTLVPFVFSNNAEELEKHQLPIKANAPYPYYNPFLPPNLYLNQKNFLGLISTSTTTSTSVVTTTCTVSTGTKCQRRRGIEIQEDEDIEPSLPVGVEATYAVDDTDIREKREPKPQYYYAPVHIGYQPNIDISPSFEKNVQRPFPYPGMYGPYVAPQAFPNDERLFFNVYVVTTSITTSTTTSTSRPTCSSESNFNKC